LWINNNIILAEGNMFELFSPSQTAPLRLSLFGQKKSKTSSKNKRKSKTVAAGPSSFDEENALKVSTNLFSKSSDRNPPVEKSDQCIITKKTPEATNENNSSTDPSHNDNKNFKMMDYAIPTIITDTENLKVDDVPSNPSPNVSECGTELSSVLERREWLKNFGKKQSSNAFRSMDKEKARDNDDRNYKETNSTDTDKERRESPPPSSINSCATISRHSPSINAPSLQHITAATTSRPSPSINASSLQHITAATTSRPSPSINVPSFQHTIAAIKPSSAKKPRNPRPRINRRASSSVPSWVSEKKKEEVKATDTGYASVASLSKWLEADPTSEKKKRHVRRGRNIISKTRQFEKDGADLIVMENQISRGAVGNKKKWLENAFQGIEEDEEDDISSTFSGYVKSEIGRSARFCPSYNRQGAQTEIITDDAASNMSVTDKKDWLKKAFVKNSEDRKNHGHTTSQTDIMHNRGPPRDEVASRAKLRFKERSARKLMDVTTSTRPSGKVPPTAFSTNAFKDTNRVVPKEKGIVESDKELTTEPKIVHNSESIVEEEMDFRSARDLIVQRSNRNGYDTQVKKGISRGSLRMKRNEKLDMDSQNSWGGGLVLKPSWDRS